MKRPSSNQRPNSPPKRVKAVTEEEKTKHFEEQILVAVATLEAGTKDGGAEQRDIFDLVIGIATMSAHQSQMHITLSLSRNLI
jgi:hypothetical protein